MNLQRYRKVIIIGCILLVVLSVSILIYKSSLDDYQPIDNSEGSTTETATSGEPEENTAMNKYLQDNVITFRGMETKSSEKVFSDSGFDVLDVKLVNIDTNQELEGLAIAKNDQIIIPPASDITEGTIESLGIPQSILDFIISYNNKL